MELHRELKGAIDDGVHGHLVTLEVDGRAQVTMVWLGRDGDDVLVAHLGAGQKMRNITRDPRVAVSIEVAGKTGDRSRSVRGSTRHWHHHRGWRA